MATRRSKPPSRRKFKAYIASAVLGFIASAAALVLFSLFVFFLRLPIGYSRFFSLLAFATGCLVSGFAAGRMKRQGGLAAGIKAALLYALPIVVIGFIVGDLSAPAAVSSASTASAATPIAATVGSAAFGKFVVAVMCGAAGGVLGVNKNGGF